MYHRKKDGTLVHVHEEVLANPELNYHLECERRKAHTMRRPEKDITDQGKTRSRKGWLLWGIIPVFWIIFLTILVIYDQ